MGAQQSTTPVSSPFVPPTSNSSPKSISVDEVSNHSSSSSLWLIVDDIVYDLTAYQHEHPGGSDILLRHAGTDATLPFNEARHPPAVREEMKHYAIGLIDQQHTAEKEGEGDSKCCKKSSGGGCPCEGPSNPAPASSSSSSNNPSSSPAPSKEGCCGGGGSLCACEERRKAGADSSLSSSRPSHDYKTLVLFGTQSGISRRFAEEMKGLLENFSNACVYQKKGVSLSIDCKDMKEMDVEHLTQYEIIVFILSSFTDGCPPPSASDFFNSLCVDMKNDFRAGPAFLSRAFISVFGCGNSIYENNYNKAAKTLYDAALTLGGKPICNPGYGDDNNARADNKSINDDYKVWSTEYFLPALQLALLSPEIFQFALNAKLAAIKQEKNQKDNKKGAHQGKGKQGKQKQKQKQQSKEEKKEEEEEELADAHDSDAELGELNEEGEKLTEMEELSEELRKAKQKKLDEEKESKKEEKEKKFDTPMLTDKLRAGLSQQGYRLIGTHSGVKLCRWTKNMLKGNGGCYKHTMYGIQSYACMEMTPSLACANKCTFCWRHYTNPVGKEWKWKIDEPEYILQESLKQHQMMIKAMKGTVGVSSERHTEAMTIRHCALSLVGEPIMYPHINRYVRLLHEKKISTFLVTNAQFPERIRQMDPVTQLYISIDASNAASLKAVDRPLFSDFWDRYIGSMKALKEKQIRTVYRLTLIKGKNMGSDEEIAEYANLIMIGRPTLIEVKGFTFCGNNDASDLRVTNVPYHNEVVEFCQKLAAACGDQYQVACEHKHSLCVLIADKKMRIDGQWCTWINYDKFHELVQEYYRTGKMFDAMDYAAPTPHWAIIGSPEAGFNPAETRVYKKGKFKGLSTEQAEANRQTKAEAAAHADDS